jgi:CheY-like chemotaxis protein
MQGEPVNILLVDDEPRNLEVIEAILEHPEYRLIRALGADEALRELISAEMAVIVLDVRMPGTSGFELAQLIKQRKKTQHIPIIFLTAC